MTSARDNDAVRDAAAAALESSLATRDSLRAYLEARRAQVPFTSDGGYERSQLERWITWLKGAI